MMTNSSLCSRGARLDPGHHRHPQDPSPDLVSLSLPTAGHHHPFPRSGGPGHLEMEFLGPVLLQLSLRSDVL
jgi:hypothetical protein